MVCAAKEAGIDNCIIPKANIAEGRIMNNINIYGVETLSQTIEILKNIAVIDGSRKNIKQADVKSGECNKSDGNINNDTYNVLERSRVKFTYGSEVKIIITRAVIILIIVIYQGRKLQSVQR